jgi:D-glycero-D-manno-heptose 1,7-bisphosphate phosphatase
VALLAREGARLDAVFYSYGHPEGVMPHFRGPSLDRKPAPYNLFIAAAQLDLDLARSWFVGDRETDVACAQAAGVRPILVNNPRNSAWSPIDVAANLTAAASLIIESDRAGQTASLADPRATQA